MSKLFMNPVELENVRELFKTLAKQRPSIKGKRIVAVWTDRKTSEIYKVTNTSFSQFQNYVKWLSDPEQRVKQAWNNYCSRQKRSFKGFTSHFPEDAQIEIMIDEFASVKRADECEAVFKHEQAERRVRMQMPASPLMHKMVDGTVNDNYRTYKELLTKENYDQQFAH